MRSVLKVFLLGLSLTMAPLTAQAKNVALILAENDYRHLPDVGEGRRLVRLVTDLEERGFRVFYGRDIDAEDSWDLVQQFRDTVRAHDRVFVFVSGHVVSTRLESWLLTRFAKSPSDLSVGKSAVAMQPIMSVAGKGPGQSVFLIAPSGRDVGTNRGLVTGAGQLRARHGVTLAIGPEADLLTLADKLLAQDGASLFEVFKSGSSKVQVSGFNSDAVSFLPLREQTTDNSAESALWQLVQDLDTVEGYAGYLDNYPYGRFRLEAQNAIDAIQSDPNRRAREAEERLGLSRDDRRSIQQNLSILGFDPKGIDGIFGPGTRTAIGSWQRSRGYGPDGFLSGNQVIALEQAGAERARELAEEAEQRRIEQERLDRAYWNQTGRHGGEADLRAYLERYPDGLFAQTALAQLQEIEDAVRAALAAEERAFWDEVRAKDTVSDYRRYVQAYPNGAFVEASQARISVLQSDDDNSDQVQGAKAEEASVASSKAVRLLVETRLASLGYDVESVDGVLDENTRRAIRQFQRARNLPVTGFVTQSTMVHLMLAR